MAQSQSPLNMQTDENGDTWVLVGKYMVKVIRGVCSGAASCMAVSPDVFELDSLAKAIVKAGANDLPENILMAAQSCPTKAILIVDTETGEQMWPEVKK